MIRSGAAFGMFEDIARIVATRTARHTGPLPARPIGIVIGSAAIFQSVVDPVAVIVDQHTALGMFQQIAGIVTTRTAGNAWARTSAAVV